MKGIRISEQSRLPLGGGLAAAALAAMMVAAPARAAPVLEAVWRDIRGPVSDTQMEACKVARYEISGPGAVVLREAFDPDIGIEGPTWVRGIFGWNQPSNRESPFNVGGNGNTWRTGTLTQRATRWDLPAGTWRGNVFLCPPTKCNNSGCWGRRQAARVQVDFYPPGRPVPDERAAAVVLPGSGAAPTAGPAVPAAPVTGAKAIVNLARGKPATQSSVYGGTGVDQGAHFGVDGVLESKPRDPYMMVHTNADNPAWWQVDLQGVHPLTQLKFYNRKACCQEKAKTLQVLLSADGKNWQKAYAHNGSPIDVLTVDLKGQNARFVRLQLAEPGFLHFQEAEVYGY